jgi:hypothetical protein
LIGGTDVTIPTKAGATALDICLRAIRREWPEAVFEDALTGRVFNDYSSIPLKQISELFVFRDRYIACEWENRGCEPGLENTMIHLKPLDDSITLIVDDSSEMSMNRILSAVRAGLNGEVLDGPGEIEARPPHSLQANSPDSTSQSAPK